MKGVGRSSPPWKSLRLGVEAAVLDNGKMVGGIVLSGFGADSAKIRAVAMGSAMVLNSATGVAFPGAETAPPMIRTDLARRNIVGECEAARARLVRGPMAMMVMLPGGFSSRTRKISR